MSRSLPSPTPHSPTHLLSSAFLHTCGSCRSRWSHTSFIKMYSTGTHFWVQPVSIRPQRSSNGSFITIKGGAMRRGRCWNLLADNSLYSDLQHKHYQHFWTVWGVTERTAAPYRRSILSAGGPTHQIQTKKNLMPAEATWALLCCWH